MIGELTPSGAVELAVLERSGFRESSHIGAAVVLDPFGEVLIEHGDVDALIYPRSTMKLMQAVAVLRSGVDLAGEQLVLASASHIGTVEHVRVVRQILDRAGLGVESLQCPLDWPNDSESRRAVEEPSRLTMNCSGKHAAFLLACVENGWPIDSYLAPTHPLQQLIRRTVEDFSGETVEHSGTDGCGAPVHALTLRGLARAVGRIGRGADDDSARLADAIRRHPWALDNRNVVAFITETGLIAKSGAEGVLVAADENGAAVAVKILDGSQRAAIPVALSLLAAQGIVSADVVARVTEQTAERVLGGGVPVGELRSTV